ncbi:MAG: restriction endonuclease subunit S [Desulfuromonadaceae bacterium]|jgi:type I restriction enzyme S subunit|nr:restriction endonuclease subunit S [Desulfuromonadaceae bacterium]
MQFPNRTLLNLDKVFLEYFFRGAVDFSKVISGAAQPQITRQSLSPVEISFPTFPEQKRIVAILDEAFAGIDAAVANTEKNLDNVRELFESYLNTVFTQKGDGWVEKTIGEISAVKGGKRVPKGYKLQSEPTKHPYITVANFSDEGSVDLEGLRYVSEEVHAEIRRYTISPKDLYISIAGTIGKTGIIPDELDGANLTENACKLVFNEEVVNRFVFFFTKTASFTEQALQNTRVAAQPKLALSRLATIKLSIPSVTEQQRVIASCDAFGAESQRLEAIYQQKLEALAELKQSILQKAFAGELTALPDKQIEEAVA